MLRNLGFLDPPSSPVSLVLISVKFNSSFLGQASKVCPNSPSKVRFIQLRAAVVDPRCVPYLPRRRPKPPEGTEDTPGRNFEEGSRCVKCRRKSKLTQWSTAHLVIHNIACFSAWTFSANLSRWDLTQSVLSSCRVRSLCSYVLNVKSSLF